MKRALLWLFFFSATSDAAHVAVSPDILPSYQDNSLGYLKESKVDPYTEPCGWWIANVSPLDPEENKCSPFFNSTHGYYEEIVEVCTGIGAAEVFKFAKFAQYEWQKLRMHILVQSYTNTKRRASV